MSENMGKDELKSRVCHWYTECNQQKILKNIIYDVLREKQALDMVLNLIENYDPDTAAWMNRCHELEIKLAQKPKVSREKIEKALIYVLDATELEPDGTVPYHLLKRQEVIFEQSGIEVEE